MAGRATLLLNMETQPQIQNALLVLQSQEGDAQAFAGLVLLWQGRLWNHACRLTGDSGAADDVVQETWAAVVNGLIHLEDEEAFPKWIFQIATHKCHDWIRKQRRHRWLKRVFSRESSRKAAIRPPHAMDALEDAIESLSEKHRAVVSLHYFEGFDINETAHMLSVPAGTVKSRLAEARERIRANVEAQTNEFQRLAEKHT